MAFSPGCRSANARPRSGGRRRQKSWKYHGGSGGTRTIEQVSDALRLDRPDFRSIKRNRLPCLGEDAHSKLWGRTRPLTTGFDGGPGGAPKKMAEPVAAIRPRPRTSIYRTVP